MFSAWPLSGRSPVSGSTSAYLTDELPELSTRTRPAEPGEPAMAGMLPGAGRHRVAGAAGAAGLPGVRGGRDAPARRLVLGRAAHLPHGVRRGDEHAAGDRARRARPALGGPGAGDRGRRRGGAAAGLEPDRANTGVPAPLYGRGG